MIEIGLTFGLLLMITPNCVFPVAGQFFSVKPQYFDLHYKYMFYSICSMCVLCAFSPLLRHKLPDPLVLFFPSIKRIDSCSVVFLHFLSIITNQCNVQNLLL